MCDTLPVMPDEIEGLARRVTEPGDSRTETIIVRVKPATKQAIRKLAKERKLTLADTVRSLLRAGMLAEQQRK